MGNCQGSRAGVHVKCVPGETCRHYDPVSFCALHKDPEQSQRDPINIKRSYQIPKPCRVVLPTVLLNSNTANSRKKAA